MIVSPLLFWVRFENSMMCFKFKRSCVWKTHSNKTNSTSVDRGKVDDNGDPFGVGFHKLEICRHRCSRNDMAVEQNQRKSNKPYTRNVEMSPFLWRIPAKVPGPTFQGNMCFLPCQFIMISFHAPLHHQEVTLAFLPRPVCPLTSSKSVRYSREPMLNKRRSSSWPLAQFGGLPYVVLVIGKCHQLGPETFGGVSVWRISCLDS